jgi:hypothetical protein
MEQTIINANIDIKERTSDSRNSIKQTIVKQFGNQPVIDQ